jgi:hypothetical protein
MNIGKKIQQRYKYGLVLNAIYGRLKSKKIEIKLYYLVQEGFLGGDAPKIEPKLKPVVSEFLKPSDTRIIASKAERDYSEEEMIKMLSEGCKCLCIRHEGEITAYMWYNLKKCESKLLTFQLKEDEAYLYGARTLDAYKGKSLAPYLRYELYKHLNQIGRTRLYSLTDFGNVPAIMFKRKLNAKLLKLYLNIKIFKKYQWDIPIKNYKC